MSAPAKVLTAAQVEAARSRARKKAAANLARAKRLRDVSQKRYDAVYHGLFSTAAERKTATSALRVAEGAVVFATTELNALL